MKIIDYKIVYSYGEEISWIVRDFIKDGWVPFGGISHTWNPDTHQYTYCQAVVKYE